MPLEGPCPPYNSPLAAKLCRLHQLLGRPTVVFLFQRPPSNPVATMSVKPAGGPTEPPTSHPNPNGPLSHPSHQQHCSPRGDHHQLRLPLDHLLHQARERLLPFLCCVTCARSSLCSWLQVSLCCTRTLAEGRIVHCSAMVRCSQEPLCHCGMAAGVWVKRMFVHRECLTATTLSTCTVDTLRRLHIHRQPLSPPLPVARCSYGSSALHPPTHCWASSAVSHTHCRDARLSPRLQPSAPPQHAVSVHAPRPPDMAPLSAVSVVCPCMAP